MMKTPHVQIKYGILMLMTGVCFSCSDDLNSIVLKDNRIMFAATMEDWEHESLHGDVSDSIHDGFSRQLVAVKDHNELSLVATTGEGMRPCKSIDIEGKRGKSSPTRAVLVNDVPTGSSDRFMMTSYYGDNKENVYFSHEKAMYSTTTGGVPYWIMENEQYWQLISRQLSFYAWYPCDDENVAKFDDTSKTITYMVPTDVTSQKDLLYATTSPAYYYEDTKGSLNFKHALTAIRFVVKNGIAGNLTNIQMRYVVDTGTFDMDNERWTPNYESHKTFSIDLNRSLTAGSDVVLNPNEYTFLMIPQDVTRNSIQVVFTMGSGDAATEYFATLSAVKSSSGTSTPLAWEKGKTITYTLTKGEGEGYVIYATSTDADYTGETKATISVTSYKLANNNTTRVKWKVTGYSIDMGQKWNAVSATSWTSADGQTTVEPWITGSYTSTSDATDGREAKTISLTTKKAAISEALGKGEEINQYLKNASEVTDLDLSYYDGRGNKYTTRETANCYVVRAGGTYKFPAVYGNAIKNGATNASAYNYDNFENYLGNKPKSPWIPDDTGKTPYEAKVVWVEPAVKDVISSVSYNSATKMVHFTVDKTKIYQGNAVIGLYDDAGTIMWSWHIWFTNAYDQSKYPDMYANSTYTFAPEILGAVLGGRRNIFASRSVLLRIEQVDDSGNVIAGSSAAKVFVTHGSGWEDCRFVGGCYYEWGRKEPFLCHFNVTLTNGESKYSPSAEGLVDYKYTAPSTFGYTANPTTGTWSNAVGYKIDIRDAIQHPNWFKPVASNSNLPNRGSWMKTYNIRAWNGSNTLYTRNHNAITKTIYDPCPRGYHVPASGVFNANYAVNSSKAYWDKLENENGVCLYHYIVAPLVSGNGELHIYPLGAINWPDGNYANMYGTTYSPNGTNPWLRLWTAGPTGMEGSFNLRAQLQSSVWEPNSDYGGVSGNVWPVAD